MEEHNTFIRVLIMDVPKDELCIDGRFVYTVMHKLLKAGHVKTEAYMDNQRRSDTRFDVEGFEKT